MRAWRQVDRDTLRRALEESALCQPIPPDANVDTLFDTYDNVLSDTLIVWRRYTLYDVVLTAVRRGSMPTAVMYVASAAAMNVTTGRLVLSLTDVSG